MNEAIESHADAEDDSNPDLKHEDHVDGSTWYFVDQSIKERLGTGDGPSFSVASLFQNSIAAHVPSQDEPTEDNIRTGETQSAPTFLNKRNSLFILDKDDRRIAGVGDFFRVDPRDVTVQDLKQTRREIKIIVQNKFKRLERNHEKFSEARPDNKRRQKPGRRRFKKRKT
ncbi:Hypothetical protein NTJ_00917 [Nesidiocoris tenuis]|uniref:Fcf2 pre-rRNA processing C-terminal domain-containing protein n=1 Tax=Nesidiocoris tenuis TaxID=355587 RepID=A0ABN7AB85_9HEMI|nr:Hypothetical protein NTJ_00917 [Nesidiocoris tenuis]